MKKEINIRQMTNKQKGIISKLTGSGSINRRIREMGLVPGTEIELIRRAPLTDPIHLKINQAHLTLRNKEADTILVTITEES